MTGSVLDLLLIRGESSLPELLKLPPLLSLVGRLDIEADKGLEHDYASLGKAVTEIAVMYRDQGPEGVASQVGTIAPDEVAIVLGLIEPGKPSKERPGGLLARAHNKIKHRFAVIEDIAALGPAAGGHVLYTHYPRHQRAVLGLVHNITQVALVGAELAALMIALDQAARQRDAQRADE